MEFQKKVENNLDTLPCKAIYHDDSNIVKIIGRLGNGVDHLLIFNDGIITIQDKQEKNKPKMHHVRHFITETAETAEKPKKKISKSKIVKKSKIIKKV